MTEHYFFSKRALDSKSRSADDADLPWLRKRFPTHFRVTAFRAREGVPRDPGLEQHFDTDARGFKAAKAYAVSLVSDGTATNAGVDVEAQFPSHFYVRYRNIGGWTTVISNVFEAEAGPSEREQAEEDLRTARRTGNNDAVWALEKRIRVLGGCRLTNVE